MTSQEMMKAPPLKPGYWWENISPLGSTPDWQPRVAPRPEDDRLFGYDRDAFMAKQYRPRLTPTA
jgi:hypothetical protein